MKEKDETNFIKLIPFTKKNKVKWNVAGKSKEYRRGKCMSSNSEFKIYNFTLNSLNFDWTNTRKI